MAEEPIAEEDLSSRSKTRRALRRLQKRMNEAEEHISFLQHWFLQEEARAVKALQKATELPDTASPTTASPLLAVGEYMRQETQASSHLRGNQIEDIAFHVAQCSDCKGRLAQSMLSFGTLVLDVPGSLLPSMLARLGSQSSADTPAIS